MRLLVVIYFVIGFVIDADGQVIGTYKSNFAPLDVVQTVISFSSDGSFYYRYKCDVLYDEAKGTYKVEKDTVSLIYDTTLTHTIQRVSYRSSKDTVYYVTGPVKHDLFLDYRPVKYLVLDDKLYLIKPDGTVLRKIRKYKRERKYFLFGKPFWKPTKYYLSKN